MPTTLTFKLRDWSGPAGRGYIQGVKFDGKDFFVFQADPEGSTEHLLARRHDATLDYRDYDVYRDAGHGSSTGVQLTDLGTRIWVGHKKLGPGYYLYGAPNKFYKTPGIPNGDIAIDADNDLLCVRAGTRYRGYTLSSVEAGTPILIFDARIADWFNRFQGHSITVLEDGNIVVLVHRDVITKGNSRADWFRVEGGKKLTKFGSQNTTDYGDEAEGFLIYEGYVWFTSRVGGNNSGRTVVATRSNLRTGRLPAGSLPQPPKIVINGKEYDPVTTVSVAVLNDARATGNFSRHVWYMQTWLKKVGYDPGPLDGYWHANSKTQRALDAFRWDHREQLRFTDPKDGQGTIGTLSLALLNDLARSAMKIREEK